MSQKITTILWSAILVLGMTHPAVNEEASGSLPVDTQSTIESASSETAAPAGSDSPMITSIPAKDSTSLAAILRDSTAHAMLAAMENEASMKALTQEEPAPTGKPEQSVLDKITGTCEQLPQKAMRYPWLLFAAAAVAFSTGAIVMAAGRRSKRESRRFMTTTRLSLMNSEVQRACLHIEKNYSNAELSPKKVCSAIITGEPFLETLFEKELGMNINAYINQVRIHRAKLLVNRGQEIDIKDVAAQVGFSDTSVFEEQFKLVTGVAIAVYCREKQAAS